MNIELIMKIFLKILFLIILTTSMILVGAGCEKTVKAAANETPFVETTETVAIQAAPLQTTISEDKVVSASPGTPNEDETAGWKTYTNGEYGFEFKYPEDLQITNGFEPYNHLDNNWRVAVFGDTNGKPVVSIVIYRIENESTYPRYFDAELRIGVSSDPQDLASCGNPDAYLLEAVPPVEVINGITFNRLIIQDAGMMQYLEGISYRTIHNGKCFAIEQLKTGSSYREDQSSPEDIPDAELDSYYDSISDIIKTFKFTDTVPTAVAVGDSYGGGIVAYIFKEGDLGYVQGEQHGLIAAKTDQTIGGGGIVVYSNVKIMIGPAAQGTAIGTGKTNTEAIIGQAGCESGAAYLCHNLNEGGYNDWFLPSKYELEKMYNNRALIGNFSSRYYWSSTESTEDQNLNDSFAFLVHFQYGLRLETTKIFFSPVRAVRYF